MTAPSIELYLIPGSSALFPHMLLRHLKLPFTPRPVTLAQVHHPDYISPTKRQVPVLVLNGHDVYTENIAICHAIHQIAGSDSDLFGQTPQDFVKTMEWLTYIVVMHAQAWGPFKWPERYTTNSTSERAVEDVKNCGQAKTLERFGVIEKALVEGGGLWLLGEKRTAADFYIFPFYRLAQRLMKGVDMAESFPAWTKAVKALGEMEAVKEALAAEQQMAEALAK